MRYNFDEIIDRKNTNSMSVEGFRSYIFHDKTGTMKFPYADDEFIRMWVADMEFATPDIVIDAMKKRIDSRIFGYTSIFDPEYYNSFAEWTETRYGWHCEKEALVNSSGIIPALFELVSYICAKDEKVLFLSPSYAFFKYAADHNELDIVCSDLINNEGYYTIDFDDLENKLKDEKISLCIFCNPHNPTGRVWKQEELERFGALCKKYNKWIISDEIHCDLTRKGMQHIPLAKVIPDYDKLVTCMAPTKTFNMAGLRISNIIIPNTDLRAVWLQKHYNSSNPVSIAAAQAAYGKGNEWLNQLQDYLDINFQFVGKFLKAHLPKAEYRISEATYLAWINVKTYLPYEDNLPLFFANKAGVLLEGGNMFVQNSDGFIRLNLACPRSVVEEGMKRISEAIHKEIGE